MHAGENNAAKAQIAAAAMAAAALLSAAPVEAGVVLTQPELKKVGSAGRTVISA